MKRHIWKSGLPGESHSWEELGRGTPSAHCVKCFAVVGAGCFTLEDGMRTLQIDEAVVKAGVELDCDKQVVAHVMSV